MIVNFERIRGLPSSGFMLLCWSSLGLASLVSIHSTILEFYFSFNEKYSFHIKNGTLFVHFLLVFANLGLNCLAEKTIEQKLRYFPLNLGTILSRVSFGWMTGLIWNSYKTGLVIENLWQTLPVDRSEHLTDLIEKQWSELAANYLLAKRKAQEKELLKKSRVKSSKKLTNDQKGRENVEFLKLSPSLSDNGTLKRPSLFLCLIRAHFTSLLFTFFLKFSRDICVLVSPLILG